MAPKAGFDPEPVQAWLDEHHGGERLVAFTRVFTNTGVDAGEFGGTDGPVTNTAATIAMLGLDDSRRWPGLLGRVGIFAVTADNLHVLRVGGLRSRIKATLLSETLDAVTFAVRDVPGPKRLFRHWVVGLPDGQFIIDVQLIEKSGEPTKPAAASNAFLAALGRRVRNLTGTDTG